MASDLLVILQQLQAEKSIDRETLIEAIRTALESAARRSGALSQNVTVEWDQKTGAFKVYEIRTVVEQVEDPVAEVTMEEAHVLNPNSKLGDRLKVLTQPKDFGRIAAQTAKQVIIQKIKDAERDQVFNEFKNREGDLITGIVKRVSHGDITVSLGKAEAILPSSEQSNRETYRQGDRVQAYVVAVERAAKGPQVKLSRRVPELVSRLFEREVPEILDGTVEIRAIAREAGSRTKVAVDTTDGNVDPVGACVGVKGARVRAVVEELSGEKIDIVRWSDIPEVMCRNSLNPAEIVELQVDAEKHIIHAIVPEDGLSLAIGKRGQNARLASRLMGWTIDIKGDAPPKAPEPLESVESGGDGEDIAEEVEGLECTAPAGDESAPDTQDTLDEAVGGEDDSSAGGAPGEDTQDAPCDGAGPEVTPSADEGGETAPAGD